MAVSPFPQKQFTAEQFVESAGAVLFDKSLTHVCLIHYLHANEWYLAKGRRNCGESRCDAALREVREETGFACQLLPLTMPTRAPPAVEDEHTPDVPRTYKNLTEPFMVTVRETHNGESMKIIWWYAAVVVHDQADNALQGEGEAQFRAQFFNIADAVAKLTFQNDRDTLERAVALVRDTIGAG